MARPPTGVGRTQPSGRWLDRRPLLGDRPGHPHVRADDVSAPPIDPPVSHYRRARRAGLSCATAGTWDGRGCSSPPRCVPARAAFTLAVAFA